jgi:outer membrane protein insertion porin family
MKLARAAFAAVALVCATIPLLLAPELGAVVQANAAVVSRIDVHGNVRMDSDTIVTYLTISPGQNFSSQDIDDSVKALFATGLFTDVSIYQSGGTLVVEVDESGIVNEVFFEGNRRLKDAVLGGAVQTASGSTYSEQRVLSDVDRIREAYSRVGREDATVSYEIVPLANNRVNVIYRINEGDKTKIRTISFIGNNAYSGTRLREILETKQTNIFSWLRNDDIYDPDKLRSDEERLRRFYLENGYADFQVLSSDVNFDEVDNQYLITINVDEGPRYRFGEISLNSAIPEVSSDDLYFLLTTISGHFYNAKKVEDSIISVTEYLAERGYAFVEVAPRGDRQFDTDLINVNYQIDEGPRVYIQQINIIGNDRTRDHVIRREFDISEGDPLNQVLIQKTKRRLEALGYFESVDITTRPGDSPDRAIVTVRVVDKATGEFSIGGGYSTTNGALGEISFSEKNFLGRGQYIKISAGFGTDEQNYTLSFTEPYFLGYRMSAGFDIYSQTSDATSNRQYSLDAVGGVLRLGAPITDNLNAQLFYTIVNESGDIASSLLDPGGIQGDSPGEVSAALATNTDWLKSGFGYSLTYVDVDNTQQPREGTYWFLRQTAFGAGGDAQYLQTEGRAVGYLTLLEDFDVIGMLRTRGGVNTPFNESGYRARDNYFQGSRDVRGFDSYGFGPRDSQTGDAIGGLYFWNATAEVTFPFPYIPESLGIRGAVFADAGQLWGVDSTSKDLIIASGGSATELDDNTLRASVGASVIWASPFGPLRFDYAYPISKAPWDVTREFTFGVSSSF